VGFISTSMSVMKLSFSQSLMIQTMKRQQASFKKYIQTKRLSLLTSLNLMLMVDLLIVSQCSNLVFERRQNSSILIICLHNSCISFYTPTKNCCRYREDSFLKIEKGEFVKRTYVVLFPSGRTLITFMLFVVCGVCGLSAVPSSQETDKKRSAPLKQPFVHTLYSPISIE
jgi:hypothetical protein